MKLKEKDVEEGYLYLTSSNQYRAVLAMKGEFMIYAPSLEGTEPFTSTMPFDNQPFKKCQIVTFAKKDYQVFHFNGTDAIKHKLNDMQLAEAIAQCNAMQCKISNGGIMIDDDKLTPEQFSICRLKSTEPPFTGKYVHCKTDGIYHCVCCDAPLFDSQTKYDSGSGWASFWQAIENRVAEHSDDSHGMRRVEIVCTNCEAHLGHVFTDGIEPTGLRYCLNSGALQLRERQ